MLKFRKFITFRSTTSHGKSELFFNQTEHSSFANARLFPILRSADGNTLIVASTDGYCSIISFQPGQLGTPYTAPVEVAESERSGAADASSILDDSTVKTENETDASTAKSAEESMETGDDSILEEEDEDEDDDLENDSGDLNVSKDGIPLNKEGVCSPAEIKIRFELSALKIKS